MENCHCDDGLPRYQDQVLLLDVALNVKDQRGGSVVNQKVKEVLRGLKPSTKTKLNKNEVPRPKNDVDKNKENVAAVVTTED